MYYTYILIDPRTDQPFYVGKGQGKRMYNHGKKVTPNPYLYNKIQKIKSLGLEVIYEKWFEGDEEFCLWMEIYLISEFGRDTLCNLTDGGEGQSGSIGYWKGKKRPIETCIKISIGHIGLLVSQETRDAMSKTRKGRKRSWNIGGMKDKHHSEEAKSKMSKAKLGLHISPETEIKPGQHLSPSTEFTSESVSGRDHPMFGRKHSEESKAKMRETKMRRIKVFM